MARLRELILQIVSFCLKYIATARSFRDKLGDRWKSDSESRKSRAERGLRDGRTLGTARRCDSESENEKKVNQSSFHSSCDLAGYHYVPDSSTQHRDFPKNKPKKRQITPSYPPIQIKPHLPHLPPPSPSSPSSPLLPAASSPPLQSPPPAS